MTVIPLPRHGQWVSDLRGEGRSIRVSAHVDAGLLNVSLWRGGACVGTAHLLPEDAAGLISGISDGLAEMAAQHPAPVPAASGDAERLQQLEQRLTELESRVPPTGRRRAVERVGSVVRSARAAWLSPRNRLFREVPARAGR
ncbi:MAG: hypothetical protein AVDCRST_MAG57-3902 [uncultured Blastococcus sp.]|uniref:Uncharacterized protein n=1 Tax=uncultured Blastococcus sp. TaxID=217144 RepID=A0A6J4JLL4_9ACTN|nr:MAG: hypothetical protein AVDCRST_MAG57-3902 [uncultured Blastococcus sp.]